MATDAGAPMVCENPRPSASAMTSQYGGPPTNAATAWLAENSAMALSEMMSIGRDPSRSVMTPAWAVSSNPDTPKAVNANPTAAADPVSSSTYQPSAAKYTKLPLLSDSIEPRKSRNDG